MRLTSLLITALILASACNLNSQPETPTAAPTTPAPQQTASANAPTLTALPGATTASGTPDATRTPFNSDAPPTAQIIGAPGTFTAPTSGERATITSPVNGANVGGSPLYLSGIVSNLPQDQFTLQVFDANDSAITGEQTITLNNPNRVADVPWSASVSVGGYTGAATIRISAQTGEGAKAVIGAVSINIVAATANPAPAQGGAYSGSITSPTNGGSASGDPITVTGTAGGIPDNQFTLLLLNASGTVLNSQLITLTGAETNTVPWSATLGTGGYRGSAEIRAVAVRDGQQVTIASSAVTLQ